MSEMIAKVKVAVEKMKVKEDEMENLQQDDVLTEKLSKIDKAIEAREVQRQNAVTKVGKLERKKGKLKTAVLTPEKILHDLRRKLSIHVLN